MKDLRIPGCAAAALLWLILPAAQAIAGDAPDILGLQLGASVHEAERVLAGRPPLRVQDKDYAFSLTRFERNSELPGRAPYLSSLTAKAGSTSSNADMTIAFQDAFGESTGGEPAPPVAEDSISMQFAAPPNERRVTWIQRSQVLYPEPADDKVREALRSKYGPPSGELPHAMHWFWNTAGELQAATMHGSRILHPCASQRYGNRLVADCGAILRITFRPGSHQGSISRIDAQLFDADAASQAMENTKAAVAAAKNAAGEAATRDVAVPEF